MFILFGNFAWVSWVLRWWWWLWLVHLHFLLGCFLSIEKPFSSISKLSRFYMLLRQRLLYIITHPDFSKSSLTQQLRVSKVQWTEQLYMLLSFLQGIHGFFCFFGSIRSFRLTLLTLSILDHKLILFTTHLLIQRLSSVSTFLNSLARC